MHMRRLLILSLFASVIALGGRSTAAHAQVIQSCSGPDQVPAQNQVILYEHANYGGQCWKITVTAPYYEPWVVNQGIPNDIVSSVKVGINTGLVLYDHVNNEWAMVGYGDTTSTTFVPYVSNDFNDKTSSFAVLLP